VRARFFILGRCVIGSEGLNIQSVSRYLFFPLRECLKFNVRNVNAACYLAPNFSHERERNQEWIKSGTRTFGKRSGAGRARWNNLVCVLRATCVSFSIFRECIWPVCPRRITRSPSRIHRAWWWRKLLWYARVHLERLLRSGFATRYAMLIRNLTARPSRHEKQNIGRKCVDMKLFYRREVIVGSVARIDRFSFSFSESKVDGRENWVTFVQFYSLIQIFSSKCPLLITERAPVLWCERNSRFI